MIVPREGVIKSQNLTGRPMKSSGFIETPQGLVNWINSRGYGRKKVLIPLCVANKCDLPMAKGAFTLFILFYIE